MVFMDSDVHKWLEALGWELGREPSRTSRRSATPDRARRGRAGGERLPELLLPGRPAGPALHQPRLGPRALLRRPPDPGGDRARPRHAATTRLLGVARRFADHIVARLRPRPRRRHAGHPEIETALVELYRHTGERALPRPRAPTSSTPAATDAPAAASARPTSRTTCRSARRPRSTATRARSSTSPPASTDLYLETGEAALLDVHAARSGATWPAASSTSPAASARTTRRGVRRPLRAAARPLLRRDLRGDRQLHWNWRMLLATGEARYADLLERTLYNGFLAGLALDGRGFFYVNPLHVRDDHATVEHGARQPWFACACCPPNVMRLLARLQHYLATSDDGGIQIHQYASGGSRRARRAAVSTDYPWSGRVEIEVAETRRAPWALACASRRWAAGARLTVDGEPVAPRAATRARARAGAPATASTLELPLDAAADRAAPAHRRRARLPGDRARPARLLLRAADPPAGVPTTCGSTRRPRCATSSAPDLLGGIVVVEAGGAHQPPDDAPGDPRRAAPCSRSPTPTGATAARAPCGSGSLSARRSRPDRARAGRTARRACSRRSAATADCSSPAITRPKAARNTSRCVHASERATTPATRSSEHCPSPRRSPASSSAASRSQPRKSRSRSTELPVTRRGTAASASPSPARRAGRSAPRSGGGTAPPARCRAGGSGCRG